MVPVLKDKLLETKKRLIVGIANEQRKPRPAACSVSTMSAATAFLAQTRRG